MQKQTIIIAAVALVIGLGGGYFTAHALGGTARASGFARGAGGATGTFAAGARPGGAAGVAGGGALTGTVAAKDATSITIATKDGSSHVALISAATPVEKTVTGSLNDVAIGSTVIVLGTSNSDGSVSATSIQLRPATTTPAQ